MEGNEEIKKIENWRNASNFSKAFDLIEESEKKICEHISEDYEGQIFIGPIGNFRALPDIETKILAARLFYENAKTCNDVGDHKGALENFKVSRKMRDEIYRISKNNKNSILDIAYVLLELVRTELILRNGIGPPDLIREAERWIRKAIRVSKDDVFHLGKMHHNLGIVLQADGRIDQAIVAYEKALEFQEKSGDKRGYALTKARRGKCYLDMAAEDYEKAFEGFYDIGDKSRISEQRKLVRNFGEFFETLFRKREEVSYNNGGWEIKPAEAPNSEMVDYRPHTGVIVVTSYLVGDMETAGEHFVDKAIPEVLFSLLPYRFLDDRRDKYVRLSEFLDLYDGSNDEVREKMKVDRINWWMGQISDTGHLAGVHITDFKSEEDRKGFVRKSLRHLYKALYQTFLLARMGEEIEEPASLKKISQLWIDYVLTSSFLHDLERIALDIVERFGFEPETEEDKLGFTGDAIREIFNLTEVEVAQRFPEIIEKQKDRRDK